ncbi:MAG: hypothetical protein GVY29_00735, partial [Spirochaetes bacterium]|nr:hypothetical protein [Spirochaetota bacterium]
MTLADALKDETVLHPIHPDIPNTVDLFRAVRVISGDPAVLDERDANQHIVPLARALGTAKDLVIVVADGLGMNLLEHLPPESLLRSSVTRELRAVYPSTT